MKQNIAVIYGGDSVEKDVSVITALQVLDSLDVFTYKIYPLYMQKDGFYMVERSTLLDTYRPFDHKLHKRVLFDGQRLITAEVEIKDFVRNGLENEKIKRGFTIKKTFLKGRKCKNAQNNGDCYRLEHEKEAISIDCAVICCHGGNGENGALQGLLDINGVPYTSAGVAASAVGMDKWLQKLAYNGLNLPVAEGILLTKSDFSLNGKAELVRARRVLGEEIIVKPNLLGSSIGINVAKNAEELKYYVEVALKYCDNVLLERYLSDITEYNCAVVRGKDKVYVSDVEIPIKNDNILSFKDKYVNEKGEKGRDKRKKASIEDKNVASVKETALFAYNALGLKGVARFDFIFSKGKLYINEVNTVPGSLAFYLFRQCGIGMTELLTIMIDYAIAQKEQNGRLLTDFENPIFESYGSFLHK